MKRVSIIIIGDEILNGLREDQNSKTAISTLKDVLDIVSVVFVKDKEKDLNKALKFATKISDIIITSGGLGLTPDDITLNVFSKAFNIPLEKSEEKKKVVLKNLSRFGKNYYEKYIDELSIGLKGSIPIENPKGVASGEKIVIKNKTFYILPGVPSEFEAMLRIIKSQLKERKTNVFEVCFKIEEKEANLISILRLLEEQFKIKTSSYPPIEKGELLTIFVKAKSKKSVNSATEFLENYLKEHNIKFEKIN